MKKEKLKEIGRFVILWAIGLSIALFLNSCTPTQYEYCETVDVYDYYGYVTTEQHCYY